MQMMSAAEWLVTFQPCCQLSMPYWEVNVHLCLFGHLALLTRSTLVPHRLPRLCTYIQREYSQYTKPVNIIRHLKNRSRSRSPVNKLLQQLIDLIFVLPHQHMATALIHLPQDPLPNFLM